MSQASVRFSLAALLCCSSPVLAADTGVVSTGEFLSVLFVVAVIAWIVLRLRSGNKTIKNYGYQKSRYDSRRGVLLSLIETEDKRLVLSYRLAERGSAHSQCSFCNEVKIDEVSELQEFISEDTLEDIHQTIKRYQAK